MVWRFGGVLEYLFGPYRFTLGETETETRCSFHNAGVREATTTRPVGDPDFRLGEI